MKNILIAGSSGMIGSIVLRESLASEKVGKVTVIVRKSLGIEHPKLTEVVHEDFLNLDSIKDYFKNQDVAQFCIGVYTGKFSNEKFKEITVDVAERFADACMAESPALTFCFLSGQGADQSEKSRLPFAKFKGMAENYLIAKKFKELYIFRPSYIYPVEKRAEPNFSYRIFRRLYPLMKRLTPGMTITSEQLGKAMFKAGMVGAGKVVLENEDIKGVIGS